MKGGEGLERREKRIKSTLRSDFVSATPWLLRELVSLNTEVPSLSVSSAAFWKCAFWKCFCHQDNPGTRTGREGS